jgi:cell wall assembly regulator SMI1
MKALLEEIRNEIARISPAHLKSTKKKYATKKEIADFEKQNKLIFPPELVEFWLTCNFEITLDTGIYKKLKCDDGPTFFMMEEFEYLVKYWEENSGLDFDEDFKQGPYFGFKGRGYKEKILIEKIFDAGWFPIAIDSYDGAICIDLNPGPKGMPGQLLYMMYIGDGKSGPYYTGISSFTDLMKQYLKLLKSGKAEVEEGIIYPPSTF